MTIFRELILDSINEEIKGTPQQMLEQVKETFEGEMLWGMQRFPDSFLGQLQKEDFICKRLQDWLQGLCSTIELPFYNHEILAWYEKALKRPINPPKSKRGIPEAEKLLDKYWPNAANTLYNMLYRNRAVINDT